MFNDYCLLMSNNSCLMFTKCLIANVEFLINVQDLTFNVDWCLIFNVQVILNILGVLNAYYIPT